MFFGREAAIMLRLLVVAAGASALVAAGDVPLDCGPDPSAVIEHGGARFSVLSPRVVRLQAPPYDDRCSFNVVRRDLRGLITPPLNFTTAVDAAGTLTIETAALVLTFAPGGGGGDDEIPAGNVDDGSCTATLHNHTDIAGHGTRSNQHPLGVPNATLASCCSACTADSSCSFFLFGEPKRAGQCHRHCFLPLMISACGVWGMVAAAACLGMRGMERVRGRGRLC